MARNRVFSFMSSLSNRDSQRSPTPGSINPPATQQRPLDDRQRAESRQDGYRQRPSTPPSNNQQWSTTGRDSPAGPSRERAPTAGASSRPMSLVQTYQPPLMELNHDTLPELQPIFTYLNSHSNKLYQEGYFLKLDDQNSHGRPNADRTWTECFAQLVGTILSLWDAAELDAAGQDGEVLPKFINLTDATIRMIESLPTRSNDDQPLQNVLSISTAGKNRYLLHFNSHHSLIQWTAGIRLAMFEHSSLQEAYTGALIGGKGKALNNIALIMERTRTKHEDWVRVRFGAGTPWRRCWCVISPPDEKEYQRLQKEMNKKKSAYDRSRPPVLRGDVKFYDTKKIKRATPIAQITNAYSAFALYPQSKPLIDASTLVKLEGTINTFSGGPTSREGFVFVMPEVRPAVSGFEMLLRWLFPAWDAFALYGRPGRLLADTVNPQSLMFAMPKGRRYGYLEILDVSGLILTDGSQNWSEMEWRRNLKDLTAKRMAAISDGSRGVSGIGSRMSGRNSFGLPRNKVEFDDRASVKSNPSTLWSQGPPTDVPFGPNGRTDSSTHGATSFQLHGNPSTPQHRRSVSESHGLDRYQDQGPALYDGVHESGPTPPPHSAGYPSAHQGSGLRFERGMIETPEQASSEDERGATRRNTVPELHDLDETRTPEPVARPPAFAHAPGTLPAAKPYHSPELRRANSRMSTATLAQMVGASAAAGDGITVMQVSAEDYLGTSDDPRTYYAERHSEDSGQRGVLSDSNRRGISANPNGPTEDVVAARSNRVSFEHEAPLPTYTPLTGERTHPDPYKSQQSSQQYPNANIPTNSTAPPPVPSHSNPSETQRSAPLGSISSPSQHDFGTATSAQPPHSNGYRQGHAYNSSTDSTISQSSRGQSISRKPVPFRNSLTAPERPAAPTSSISRNGEDLIDQPGFNQAVPLDPVNHGMPAPEPRTHPPHSNTSLYDDGASTASPDYSSTRASSDTKSSFERPRAGVMRTVGGPVEDESGRAGIGNELDLAIPAFDFGPTGRYAPNRLPDKTVPPRKPSPNRKQSSAGPSGQPITRNTLSPEPGQYRTESISARPDSRTIPWQPGMATVANNDPGRQAITPEQFVQQRAAAPTPLYAHQRRASGDLLRSGTPTPPLVRREPGESLVHSRNSSSDMFQRPNSRGSNIALAVSGTGDHSARLSAKEQEHVARVTGLPMINNITSEGRVTAPNVGLVGAIDAREREKRDIKQGMNSQAVQQAIVQRQQQAQAQAQAQYQNQARAQQSLYQGPPQSQTPAQTQYNAQLRAQQPLLQGQPPNQGPYPNPARAQQAPNPGQQQYGPQYGGQTVNPQAPYGGARPNQNVSKGPFNGPPPGPSRGMSYVNPAAATYAQGGGWAPPQRGFSNAEHQQQQQYYAAQGQGRGGGGSRGI